LAVASKRAASRRSRRAAAGPQRGQGGPDLCAERVHLEANAIEHAAHEVGERRPDGIGRRRNRAPPAIRERSSVRERGVHVRRRRELAPALEGSGERAVDVGADPGKALLHQGPEPGAEIRIR
jgi:hypothetical protein